MGPRESKIKSTSRSPPRPDHGSATVPSGHNIPKKPVHSSNAVPVWPANSMRWQSLYDVYICHSNDEDDCSYAMEMLSYLEEQPGKLRCFLPMRDMVAGSPIPTELCNGLENSHCWVMLLTPHFLSDSWCKYQMHQFLAKAPCSNGRLIPIVFGQTFAQCPPEIKHMYVFRGTLSDKSVLIKVKGAVVTYLKEMITVTSDQIPSQNSSIPEGSQSTSKTVGNDQVETSVTQESIHDRSSRNSVRQETTSDLYSRSPVTQETTSDMSLRIPVTQESTNEDSLKNVLPQETAIYTSLRSSETQVISDMSSKRPVTQETISDMSSGSSVTQENIYGVLLRSSVSEESTSGMFIRSSVTGQEATTDMFMESSMIGPKTMSISRSMTTSDMSSGSSVTQEKITGISLRSSLSEESTSDMFIRNSVTGQEATSDMSMSSSVTRQETAGNMSKSSFLSRLETPYSLQDRYNDLSLSPSVLNAKDVCTDCKCIMTATKDSLSKENRVDNNDSGVWSMTKDLLTDCSDLHTGCVDALRTKVLPSTGSEH